MILEHILVNYFKKIFTKKWKINYLFWQFFQFHVTTFSKLIINKHQNILSKIGRDTVQIVFDLDKTGEEQGRTQDHWWCSILAVTFRVPPSSNINHTMTTHEWYSVHRRGFLDQQFPIHSQLNCLILLDFYLFIYIRPTIPNSQLSNSTLIGYVADYLIWFWCIHIDIIELRTTMQSQNQNQHQYQNQN